MRMKCPSPNVVWGLTHKVVNAETAGEKIVKLALDKLLPHPLNEKLFGVTSPEEIKILAESIAETGQLSPLIVTADLEKVGYYALLSGHKRADALRLLGRAEANCQVVDVEDADERLLRLLEANLHHDPTTEQKIRIGGVHFELETKKAKARKVAGAKAAKKGNKKVETLPQAEAPKKKAEDDDAGKARDHAAKKVGMSGVSFDKGRKVLRAMEKAEAEGKTALVMRLRELLNGKGIDPAFEHAKVLDLIEQAKKNSGSGGKAKAQTALVKGVNASPNPVPAIVIPEGDASAPVPTEVAAPDDTDTEGNSAQALPDAPRPAENLAEIMDDGEQPPGVHVVTLGEKFVEELGELDVSDLTADLKRNLRNTLDDVENWHADHDEMLRPPGRL